MRKSIISITLLFLSVLNCFGQYSKTLEKKAENGSMSAQMELAKCYLEGNGVDQSQSEAAKWFEIVAKQNNLEAMIACGDLFCDEWNLDLEPNYVKGIYWYRKAAAKGSEKAQDFLRNFKISKEEISHECPFDWLPCDEDLGRQATLRENEELIRKYYKDRNPIAAYYLAILSYTNKEYDNTVKYLTEIYSLVMNEDNYFEDIIKTEDNSIPIGATIGAKVLSLLGWCYEHGQGINKDYTKAAEYYLAEFDYTAFGMSMIPKVRGAYCYKKAKLYDKFIKEAETQGIGLFGGGYSTHLHVPCLRLELAEMYKRGEGVPRNGKKALEIYESIVDKRKELVGLIAGWYPEVRSYSDVGRAAYRAAQMYKVGDGCKADEDMANLYFEIALKYGDKNAWYENQNE